MKNRLRLVQCCLDVQKPELWRIKNITNIISLSEIKTLLNTFRKFDIFLNNDSVALVSIDNTHFYKKISKIESLLKTLNA